MNEHHDFAEFDRYLSGESTPDERARIEARARQDAELRELLRAVPAALQEEPGPAWDSERAWQRLAGARRRRPFAPWRRVMWAIAATIVLAGGVGIAFKIWSATPAQPDVTSYQTAAGERRTVQLADGSRVVLAASSRLRVPASYASAERSLELEGEAFFDVVADAGNPFIVLTRNAQTRVLGTSFVVSEYPSDRAAEVVVVSGRVEFGSRRLGRATVLEPRQAARVSEDGALVIRADIDVRERVAWLEGRLVFRAVSFAAAVPTLERWYGIEIEVADSALANARVTAFFEQQSQTEVLDALAETLGARYTRAGHRITFTPK
jgi:ferric-dicitrate binding protein FerR (iron transport regulator)